MKRNAAYWIKALELEPHPEGGFYKQVYKASEEISKDALPERFSGARRFATSIYFLLAGTDVSKLHRIAADELWHFYEGSSLRVHMIDEQGQEENFLLGRDIEKGETHQNVVPAGRWFGASLENTHKEAYALVGCTVAPGFDFEDFELANRENLLKLYPQHAHLIKNLS